LFLIIARSFLALKNQKQKASVTCAQLFQKMLSSPLLAPLDPNNKSGWFQFDCRHPADHLPGGGKPVSWA
jgi:hypothetical protein